MEAQLPAVAHHHGLASHDRFFAGAARDGAVDRCGAAQLPVGFAASQVGAGDGGHGFCVDGVAGQPLWPRGCLRRLPLLLRTRCVSLRFSGEVPTGPGLTLGRWLGAFVDALRSMLCDS